MADKSCRVTAVHVLLTFILNTSVATISGFVRLEPGKPLVNQVLYHRKTVVYHLVQLQPSRNYELRISYPSTTPTDFYMRMIPQEALLEGKTRRLLNIDKLMFSSDITEHYVNVTAIRTGVPYDTASLAEPVVYNIVLDELLLGIPWHSWRLVVLVLLICYLTVKYLIPCSLSVIQESIRVSEKR